MVVMSDITKIGKGDSFRIPNIKIGTVNKKEKYRFASNGVVCVIHEYRTLSVRVIGRLKYLPIIMAIVHTYNTYKPNVLFKHPNIKKKIYSGSFFVQDSSPFNTLKAFIRYDLNSPLVYRNGINHRMVTFHGLGDIKFLSLFTNSYNSLCGDNLVFNEVEIEFVILFDKKTLADIYYKNIVWVKNF